MLRATSDPGAAYYAAFVTPSNGISIQYRTTQGGTTTQLVIPGTVPTYLAVGRSTNTTTTPATVTYTAYTSTDGVTWTPVVGSAIPLNGLTGSLQVGLAVTSHNTGALSTVTGDTVVVSATAVP
jgi:hypothetical protein